MMRPGMVRKEDRDRVEAVEKQLSRHLQTLTAKPLDLRNLDFAREQAVAAITKAREWVEELLWLIERECRPGRGMDPSA